MSSIVISGDTSGAITLAAPAVAGTNTLTLPALTGTVLTTATAGTVLQVVNVIKTDIFSSTVANAWTDITGFTASITPKSSTSKIMVVGQMYGSSSFNSSIRVVRNSTAVFIGDAAGSRPQATTGSFYQYNDGNIARTFPFSGLDSPATTSATTYKIQFFQTGSGGTVTVNRCLTDADNADTPRGVSTITLIEVAA